MIIRKIIKYLAILFAVIMLFWCIIVGLIATPKVITPKIVELAQQHIKSEISIKSVDLSLFTRFPNITLRIDSLRITQTKDSIGDLVFAKQCRIAVDPIALLSKKLKINHMSLQGASIYVYVDSLHGPLKTFILPEASEEVEDLDTLSSMDMSKYSLSLRKLKIDSTQIVIDDRTKQFYTRVDNYSVDMSMNISASQSDLDVITGFSNLIVWHKGDLLVKKTSLDLRSKMLLEMDSLRLSFDKARMILNGIDLKARGTLRQDTLAGGLQVDIRSSLNNTSITEFLNLIPASIVDTKDKITADGDVAFDMIIDGLYSDDSMPTLGATLKVDNAKAKYASRKLSLEKVNCDAYVFVDFNTPQNSYADVKSLQVNTSEIIDLTFTGKITNMIEDPSVDIVVKSDIDFDRFSEVFPLNDGIICSGKNQSNIKTQFVMSDVENSNYAKLYIDGESVFQDLDISFDASKFAQDSSSVAYLHMQAEKGHMMFGDNIIADTDSRTLRSKINFQGLNYKSKTGEYLSIKDIELMIGANFDRTTSAVNGIGIRGIAKNTNVGADSLFNANLESSDVSFIIMPKNDEREAKVKSTIASQQITVTEPIYNSKVALSSVDMDLSMQRMAEKQWDMDGTISFSDFGMFTDLFPVDVTVPQTSVSVSNRTIHLNNATLKIGESEIVATGHINNLIHKLFVQPRTALSGNLSISAPILNFSQIIETSNQSVLMMEQQTDTLTIAQVSDSLSYATDSLALASSSGFIVPKRVEFVFDLNIDKALFEDAIIEDIEGLATLKKGVLSLDKLNFRTIGAQATISVNYYNIDQSSSNAEANMSLKGVDISRIGELMPSFNTMFPMIKSFEGIVDFDIKANTNLDSNSDLDISTLCSGMRFKGKDLVLMDSETFDDLSKTLMFKNKERNIIDSLEVYALVEGSKVDVLPFEMSIDRYTAIIGGSQVIDPESFDVEYEYNVSIMKSPLPFKAGVDITGNLEDFNFKVTSAKLKKTDFDEQREIYESYLEGINESAAQLQKEVEAKRQEAMAARQARQQEEQHQN